MKKYFLYELKKNWLPAVIITVFATIIYLVSVLSADFAQWPGGYVPRSLIDIPFGVLIALCFLVPVWMFSFKMNARQCDLYYSMPLKREKIYLIKSVTGLLIIFATYTVSYWIGFAATAVKENVFDLVYFVPAYFASLPVIVLVFGINAFVFTRANKLVDGIIFIGLYCYIASMLATFIAQFIKTDYPILVFYTFFPGFATYSPLSLTCSIFAELVSGRVIESDYILLLYIIAVVIGIAAWAGLFLSSRKEKAENAERISDSKFGYITLIPFYTVTLLSSLLQSSGSINFLMVVIMITAAFVFYVIFRRSIRLKKYDWIVLFAAIALGFVISAIKYQFIL